jgi:hypothetical protein
MRDTFTTSIDMPEDIGEDMVITNHKGMRATLMIDFKGWHYQYHMDDGALKIPSHLGPSWVNNLDWEQALKLIRVLTVVIGGEN